MLIQYLLILAAYFVIAIPLSIAPRAIAGRLGKRIGKIFFPILSKESYWAIQRHVRQKRIFVVVMLVLILCAVVYGLLVILSNPAILHKEQIFVLLGISVVIAFFLSFLTYRQTWIQQSVSSNQNIPGFREFKKNVETISVTAGIASPEAVLLSHPTPGLFLMISIFASKPKLYVTTSFLKEFNSVETEACVAHEIGNFITREVRMWHIVTLCTALIEILSIALFILFLGIYPSVFLLWLIIFVAVAITLFSYGGRFSPVGRWKYITMASLIFNPAYLILLFITQFLFYLSSYGETIYSDIKAIELTRYPQGLYSALSKMKVVLAHKGMLSSLYAPFLFVGEAGGTVGSTFTQSAIEDRKTLLRSIDPSIVDMHSQVQTSHCGVCGGAFEEIFLNTSYYKKVSVQACGTCGYAWFENGMLYVCSTVDHTLEQFKPYLTIETANRDSTQFVCPDCHVPLVALHDLYIPRDITLYQCDSCDGDLISVSDFVRYVAYRKSVKKG